MNTAPSLSVCMIVRDEAEVLRFALESVRPLADQIVVVDTGSDDATLEIAREFDADVHAFAWCDDFAAARNASLDRAHGDWILVLDADEWIAPDDGARILEALRGPRDRVWEFTQRNYVADAATPGFCAGDAPTIWGVPAPGFITARQIRLLPNDARLRYEGCVHEQLEGTVRAASLTTQVLDVSVHHLGKLRSAAIMERKTRLYRALGELKLERAPDGRAYLELGVQSIELGELDRAVSLLEQALATSEVLGDRAKIIAHLAGAWSALGAFDRADTLIRDHLTEVSAYSFVWERWGSVLGQAGRTARAAEVLERASRLFDEAAGILRLLGETYLAARQHDRALSAFERLRAVAGRSGLGEAGVAVARAGAGDPAPLRAILQSDPGPVGASARAGARRWLGPEFILAAWPRCGATADDVRTLDAALRARGRSGLALPGNRSPVPRTLEGLWRIMRDHAALPDGTYERVRTTLGLATGPAVSVSTESGRGQIVQVPGGAGR